MSARPYRLVSESRLQASRLQAQDRFRRWCQDWGIAPAHFQLQVSRYAPSANDRPEDWFRGGDRRWVRAVARTSLNAEISAALFAAPLAPSGQPAAGQLGHACTCAALEAFEPALADAPVAAVDMPVVGDDLVLVELRRGDTLLAVIQPALAASSAAAVKREALSALQPADLDAALRRVPARPSVELGHTELALAELLELKTGQVVVLEQSIRDPVRIACAQSPAEVFAHLGRSADRFAVQVIRPSKTKEMKMNKEIPGSAHVSKAAAGGHVQMVDLEELSGSVTGDTPVLENRISLFGGIKAKVTAVIGNAQSSVGELLALKEGATFTLDRHVDAPIDLVVEGRVVARGQLSVLDDQFAVRVTEVIQAGAK